MKIAALAGGVGGAKLIDGLSRVLPKGCLTAIVNVGDDFEFFGLKICPDLDTVIYTLANKENTKTGWGRANDTWHALEVIRDLGGTTWFQLGDADLGLHLERTRLIRSGTTLNEFCDLLCKKWNIAQHVCPATNDLLQTIVHTFKQGDLPFQEYFVKERFEPQVSGFSFSGADTALPAPGVLESLTEADYVIICPSNPWVSIDPILAIHGIREVLFSKKVIAVSPIVGGHAIKGPAAKIFNELGIDASAYAVAEHYKDIIDMLVVDEADAGLIDKIAELGIVPVLLKSIMTDKKDRERFASEIIQICNTYH